jgi:hypothetical protein
MGSRRGLSRPALLRLENIGDRRGCDTTRVHSSILKLATDKHECAKIYLAAHFSQWAVFAPMQAYKPSYIFRLFAQLRFCGGRLGQPFILPFEEAVGEEKAERKSDGKSLFIIRDGQKIAQYEDGKWVPLLRGVVMRFRGALLRTART